MDERPRGSKKEYPGANGLFTCNDGWDWQVRKIPLGDGFIYTRWCWDGEDPGASFEEEDGKFKPMSKTELDKLWRIGKVMAT